MSKAKTQFQCESCGHVVARWQGQCPGCGDWNTLIERPYKPERKGSRGGMAGAAGSGVISAADVSLEAEPVTSTGLSELDRVLGGGLVAGGVVLLGGDPGIGKSTVLLQAVAALAKEGTPGLYVTGEASGEPWCAVGTRHQAVETLGGDKRHRDRRCCQQRAPQRRRHRLDSNDAKRSAVFSAWWRRTGP